MLLLCQLSVGSVDVSQATTSLAWPISVTRTDDKAHGNSIPSIPMLFTDYCYRIFSSPAVAGWAEIVIFGFTFHENNNFDLS